MGLRPTEGLWPRQGAPPRHPPPSGLTFLAALGRSGGLELTLGCGIGGADNISPQLGMRFVMFNSADIPTRIAV